MRATRVHGGRRPSSTDELLDLTPAAASLRAYRDAVWRDPATDPALLELCRLRLAQLLGADPSSAPPHPAAAEAGLDPEKLAELARWPTSERFSARDRAALAFAEQWLFDPSGMTDDDCARLRAALGDAGCAAFTMGLALVEALLRFELALGAGEAGSA
jgi:alkylhydroperoxidase family enzyme